MIVELGCGPARRRSTLRPADTAPVIGIDLDPAALRGHGADSTGRLPIRADALELPLRSASCDLVVLEAVLHHLVPTDRALRELARVLRPGGRARIRDGVALTADEAAALDAELGAAGREPEPVNGFVVDELIATAGVAGFALVEVRIDGRAVFATPPHVSRVYDSDRFELEIERRPDR